MKMHEIKITEHGNRKGENARHENGELHNAGHQNRWITYLLWSYGVIARNGVICCVSLCKFPTPLINLVAIR